MRTPKQTDPQFKLRLTPELDAAIEQAAKRSGRTKNALILERLEESFRPLGWMPEDLTARILRSAQRNGYTPEAEVLRTLLKAYPAPASLEGAVSELRALIKILKPSATVDELNMLADDLFSLVQDIETGRVKIDDQATARIAEKMRRYEAHGGEPGWELSPVADAWKDGSE